MTNPTAPNNHPDTLRVQVARAALQEIGRGDLAARVQPNRAGDPSICAPCNAHRTPAGPSVAEMAENGDLRLLTRAFELGHQADPQGRPDELADPTDEILGR